MKIVLRIYKEIRIGNLSTMILDIPNNTITVKELKDKIYKKYKIKPSQQRLTYRICHKKLVTLTDNFPLSFFYIKEYSMIFLEIISNDKQEKEKNVKKNNKKTNSIAFKYMNVLGYFLPDSKTLQRNENNFGAFKNVIFQQKKINSFHSTNNGSDIIKTNTLSESSKSSRKYTEYDEENSFDFVNDESEENKDSNENNKQNFFKKKKTYSTKEDKEEANNNNLRKGLSSEMNLVEKLCIYVRQNDIEKVIALISQHTSYINDLNEINLADFNYNYKTNEIKRNSNESDQTSTNYKTFNSFNSGHFNSTVSNNNICELLNRNGWNAMHYSSFLGHFEILDYIMNKISMKPNPNILNSEGWSPLLLAVHKQQIKCVEILMSLDNIDVDYNGSMGTALHVACKKNNRIIVSKLLYKANPTIKDKNNKIALEYSHDKAIVKLISKVIAKKLESTEKNTKLYEKIMKFINEYKHLLIIKKVQKTLRNKVSSVLTKKYKFLSNLGKMPKKPPFFFGEIEQPGGFFSSNKKKIIEINPIKGLLRIFKNFAKMCDNLVTIINKIINFHKFWNDTIKKIKDQKEQIINYLSEEKFDTLKFDSENNYLTLLNDLGKEIPLDEDIFKEDEITKNKNKKKDEKAEIVNANININKEQGTVKDYVVTNHEDAIQKNRNDGIKSSDIDEKNNVIINYNSFEILELIGGGSFGKVFKVKLKNTQNIYAMKVLNKGYLIKKKLLRYAITECNVLKQSNCPFILKLHYSFQTPENLYMILDYCPIGDLSYQIQLNLMEEDEAKFYIAELILAIEYLHQHDIIYRDLKPENILIDADGHLKLADFGLAKENVSTNAPNKTFCGSPQYLSPEMLSKEGTTKASDIYGIGAILFELISGSPPFYSPDENLMYKNISENKLMFPEFFSEELKDLLKKMLDKDPKNRIGIQNDKSDLKNHEFFSDINWEDIMNKKVKPPVEMIDVREEYDLKEKFEFKDVDYNTENKFIKRVPGFTFIKTEN